MSFQLNLAAFTESARDRLARLETSGGALRERFRSPPPRPPLSTTSSSPPARALGLTSDLGVGSSGEFSLSSRVSGGLGRLGPLFVRDDLGSFK
jgi:hypothetical protein